MTKTDAEKLIILADWFSAMVKRGMLEHSSSDKVEHDLKEMAHKLEEFHGGMVPGNPNTDDAKCSYLNPALRSRQATPVEMTHQDKLDWMAVWAVKHNACLKQGETKMDLSKTMTDSQKEALKLIETQLYAINARNISLPWIGLQQTPTPQEIEELNRMLGFIVLELRTLRETGELDVQALVEKYPEKI